MKPVIESVEGKPFELKCFYCDQCYSSNHKMARIQAGKRFCSTVCLEKYSAQSGMIQELPPIKGTAWGTVQHIRQREEELRSALTENERLNRLLRERKI